MPEDDSTPRFRAVKNPKLVELVIKICKPSPIAEVAKDLEGRRLLLTSLPGHYGEGIAGWILICEGTPWRFTILNERSTEYFELTCHGGTDKVVSQIKNSKYFPELQSLWREVTA